MKTLLDVLRSTAAYFEKHGVESPRLNAEHLLAAALGKKRLELYLEFDRPLGETDLAPLREKVRRRATGEPLQHLLGTAEFCGRTFRCDGRALIPRPETEELAEKILALPFARAADIGTGSGCIALTLAAERPAAALFAVDRSPDALALARENAAALGLDGRVAFLEGDLLAPLEGAFDLIAANLPYIPSAELPGLQREVQHDPALALDGGPDGLALIARLVADAPALLAPGGRLALEIGLGQHEVLIEKLRAHGYHDIRTDPDHQGINRFLFAAYG